MGKIGGTVLEEIMDNKQTDLCNFNKDLTIHSGLKSLFSIFSMKSVDKNYRWISEEAANFGQPKS